MQNSFSNHQYCPNLHSIEPKDMLERRLNKTEAGYHMLQLLSMVDDSFSINEELIIKNYLVENYPFHVSLDGAMDQISELKKEDYVMHFQKCMDDFYLDSTSEERIHFMNFAVKIVSADNIVSQQENVF
jgi:hypothetical protein